MIQASTLPEALKLEAISPGEFRCYSVPHDSGRPVVEGGQMMAQMMMAAARETPGRTIRSISALFAKAGRTDLPLVIRIEAMHAGRTLTSATATTLQEGNILSRALILLDGHDEDVIRHSASMPANAGKPGEGNPFTTNAAGSEVRIAGGVDITRTDVNGPAELLIWFRVPQALADQVANQALATSRSHLFLIAAAMRPHEGIGVGMSHDSLSTGVLTHTISFHAPIDASRWLLFAQESTFAGEGRAYGRGNVFAEDGRHVASFVQDSLIRRFPEGAPRGKTKLVL